MEYFQHIKSIEKRLEVLGDAGDTLWPSRTVIAPHPLDALNAHRTRRTLEPGGAWGAHFPLWAGSKLNALDSRV